MYLNGSETMNGFEQSSPRLQQLVRELIDGFELTAPTLTFENLDDLYEHYDEDTLFLVRDGIISLCSNGTTLVTFEEGELIGISQSFHLSSPTLCTEGFVELQPINRDDFLLHVYGDKRRQHCWSHYMVTLNSLLTNQLADIAKDQIKPAAGFQNFSAGETIIRQGDDADMVYTIISGTADVIVNGVNVGQLSEDEVFGAMAVFTHEKRTASVVAATPCTIMAVPQKDFTVLIEAQPQAAVNLIENLARRISIMNQQILDKNGPEGMQSRPF
ncbi:MAG: cyclic nucleotide-binding domain-containing protein [Pseudomonadota bacterium]|nr:cyclic nucleotide-binding domain-containing protein [Pseudomonadota bacterium]